LLAAIVPMMQKITATMNTSGHKITPMMTEIVITLMM
jgi:hypothetical protein